MCTQGKPIVDDYSFQSLIYMYKKYRFFLFYEKKEIEMFVQLSKVLSGYEQWMFVHLR